MRAMVLHEARRPLRLEQRSDPVLAPGHVLLEVRACGVCRTDLHLVDGELPDPKLPVIPGHEVVGRVLSLAPDVAGLSVGMRVGVPWLGGTCGSCRFCLRGQENLCPGARFTGYTLDGGYADCIAVDARYCFPLASALSDAHAAPLLCAGLIGYRSLCLAGPGERLGLYGFGAAAHLVLQVARRQGREVYAFGKPGDHAAQRFALSLGATWAGGSDERPPALLDAAIVYAPVGALVPAALAATSPGGSVVCAGIHMSDIPSFPYELLWRERCVRSVANLTRRDATEFLQLAAEFALETTITEYPLARANDALDDLRAGRLNGAAVLCP